MTPELANARDRRGRTLTESERASRIATLLSLAKSGDAQAHEELFEYCRNYVNVIARSNVETWMRAKVDASDLVQQTLLEAHRGFQEFQGATEGEWLGWLKQILAHNTHDFIRKYRAGKRDVKKEIRIEQLLRQDVGMELREAVFLR